MPGKFLKQLSIFLLPLLLAYGCIEYILSRSENMYTIKREMLEQRAGSLQVLIGGTAQTLHSLNPEQFSQATFNMAAPGQSLYYDFKIIRRYLPQMKKLQLVILPVEYFSLYYNIDINYKQVYSYYRFWNFDNTAIPKTSIKRYSLLAMYTPSVAIDIMQKMLTQKKLHVWFQTGKLLPNGFEPLQPPADTVGFESSAMATIKRWQTARMVDANFATNAADLEDLVKILKERNIKVLFISCPVTAGLYNKYNPAMTAAKTNLLQQIASRYSNARFIDYSADQRFNIRDFLDANHLNSRGAIKFSNIVQQQANEEISR